MKNSIQECTTYEEIVELEKHSDWRTRISAFEVPKNWGKAEDDTNINIQQQAFRYTQNWEKAENDHSCEIRAEAFRHTNNWKKALDDKDSCIKRDAYKHLYAQKLKKEFQEFGK
jgi:hypothetical protein